MRNEFSCGEERDDFNSIHALADPDEKKSRRKEFERRWNKKLTDITGPFRRTRCTKPGHGQTKREKFLFELGVT